MIDKKCFENTSEQTIREFEKLLIEAYKICTIGNVFYDRHFTGSTYIIDTMLNKIAKEAIYLANDSANGKFCSAIEKQDFFPRLVTLMEFLGVETPEYKLIEELANGDSNITKKLTSDLEEMTEEKLSLEEVEKGYCLLISLKKRGLEGIQKWLQIREKQQNIDLAYNKYADFIAGA